MQSNNIIKIEAAGAGKTYSLCESALKVTEKETKIKRVLILSYTNRGIDAIKTEIKKQNMGVLSNKIDVMSWYTFLLGELIKPYQSFLFDINEIKSLDFSEMYGKICSFANEVYSNENNMSTSMLDVTEHDGVILIAKDDLSEYYNYFLPTVLRYDKKTDTGIYLSYNFGECKGMTFERVIIFPNGPFKDFLLKGKVLKSPQKYYVAATRAKYSIAFVLDKLPAENDKWKKGVLNIGEHTIGVLDYVTSV